MTIIDPNPALQRYYASLESRLGCKFFLNDTRHYGYYEDETAFPLPVGKALRRMEGKLLKGLRCGPGSRVLDAGCGVGHVAMYMARQGQFRVEAIDVVARHVKEARRNVSAAGLESWINVGHGDYHHLEHYEDNSFEGIYTMEAFVHSTDPLGVLKEFHRILKPGGRLAMNEYDHNELETSSKGTSEMEKEVQEEWVEGVERQQLVEAMERISKYAAMPANASFKRDALPQLMRQAGFVDVELEDLSSNIRPMLFWFHMIATVPYRLVKLFGMESRFINTVAGVEAYRRRDLWRYVQVTGGKGKEEP